MDLLPTNTLPGAATTVDVSTEKPAMVTTALLEVPLLRVVLLRASLMGPSFTTAPTGTRSRPTTDGATSGSSGVTSRLGMVH